MSGKTSVWIAFARLALLFGFSAFFVHCKLENIRIQENSIVFVHTGDGHSSMGLFAPRKALEESSALALCRKKFLRRTKCQTINFKYDGRASYLTGEFDGDVLKDGKYQLRLLKDQRKVAATSDFRVLRVGKLKKHTPFDITEVTLMAKGKEKKLQAFIKLKKPIPFAEKLRIRLLEADNGRVLQSIADTIDDSKVINFKHQYQKDQKYYIEIDAYTSAFKEFFHCKSTIYRSAFSLNQAYEPGHLSDEEIYITVDINSGSFFNGPRDEKGKSEGKMENTVSSGKNNLPPFDFDAFNPRPDYETLVSAWYDLYLRRANSIKGKQIPESLQTLYGYERLDDVSIYTAIRSWLKEQPKELSENTHVISPSVIMHHDMHDDFLKDEYPRHKRFHMLPFWNVQKSKWLVLVYDHERQKYLIVDSKPRKDKYEYQMEFGVFAHYLSSRALFRTIPNPNANIKYLPAGDSWVMMLKENIPKTYVSWRSVYLWSCGKDQQEEKDDFNDGIYTIMNSIYLIKNNLLEPNLENTSQCLPRMDKRQAEAMRSRLFVGLGAKCQYFDPDLSFPSCLI